MDDLQEFIIEWLRGQTQAAITAPNGSALKGRLIKLSQDHPTECDYIQNKDGSVFGHIPVNYLHFYAPRKLSEEEKEKRTQNLLSARDKTALKSF